MILYLEDWDKYPNAIVHSSTSNSSWVRLSGLLKKMGIRNHTFMLALHNPMLEGIDCRSSELSKEEMIMIAHECRVNPWFFFREVLRVPAQGFIGGVAMRANRANICLYWLYFNHVTTVLMLIRQTGKSIAMFSLYSYLLTLGTRDSNMVLFTKDHELRTKSIKDIKDMLEELPYYLFLKSKNDVYNTEEILLKRVNNRLSTAVAQHSVKAANKVGRGLTSPIIIIDEAFHITNNHISVPALLAASTAARDSAKLAGTHYGTIFASTAGYLSSDEGRFGYKLYKSCLKWDEHLLDCRDSKELYATIKKNSPSNSNFVLLEYNHRQLGYTDEWLQQKIKDAMAEGQTAEAEFLNIWSEGNDSSPISKELLKRINSSKQEPEIEVTQNNYIIRWYVDDIESRSLVAGLDTSDAIGNDDIALCIRDITTGEVVGTGLYNETNLIVFSTWLADFLLEYSNITLIPERKSSGITIIDHLLLILQQQGENPYERIFNWVTNNITDNPEYKEAYDRPSLDIVNKHRKYFGYATSSTGKSSRDNLYGSTFTSSVKHTCDLVRDKTLIEQLNTLIRKNDRIDHKQGEHDDMVVAWLLGYYLLVHGKNLDKYGIKTTDVLKIVTEKQIEELGGEEEVSKVEEQQALFNEIENLINQMRVEKSKYRIEQYQNRILRLSKYLDKNIFSKFNIEAVLADIRAKRKYDVYPTNLDYIRGL